MSKQRRWIDLYEDFLAETDPEKLRKCLGPLELSILERLQKLNVGTAAGHEELLAIRMATDTLLEIKTTKLGFPPLPSWNTIVECLMRLAHCPLQPRSQVS